MAHVILYINYDGRHMLLDKEVAGTFSHYDLNQNDLSNLNLTRTNFKALDLLEKIGIIQATQPRFLSTAIAWQTSVVAAQGQGLRLLYSSVFVMKMKSEIVFVAALWFIAAAFWVIWWLSRMCRNVIFMMLVLFTNASVRYVNSFGSILVIHFNLVCVKLSMIRAILIELNESLVKARISKKRISERRPLRLKLRKLKRKPKSVVGQISMMANVTRIPSANGWYLESGATVHVCDPRDKFVDYQKVIGKQVIMANCDRADICEFGSVKPKFTSGNVVTLKNVYHVTSIPKCLISVSKLDRHGFKIAF
ncbi:hypothetical protein Tco_0617782 [Tanacetum coccineum]